MRTIENPGPTQAPYRLFVDADRLVLVRIWASGHTEVCTRPEPDAVWGPATPLTEEKL